MRANEQDVIVRHAFENPDRLRIALLVGAAYPEICRMLVDRQFEAIRDRLESALGLRDWNIEIDRKGTSLYTQFRRKTWPGAMVIGFGRDTPGDDLYFYARRCNAPKHLPVDDRLKVALDRGIGPSRKPTDDCPWWLYLGRYRNWSDIDTLETLATSEEPVEYIVDFLERMRQVALPILDAEPNGE